MPDELQAFIELVKSGQELPKIEVVEMTADNGTKLFDCVKRVFSGGNGVAKTAWAAVTTSGATAVTSGLAVLTMEIPAACALMAPALGLAGGYLIYNLDQEFWNNCATELYNSGCTLKNKFIAYLDEQANVLFDEISMNVIKNELLKSGIFNSDFIYPSDINVENFIKNPINIKNTTKESTIFSKKYLSEFIDNKMWSMLFDKIESINDINGHYVYFSISIENRGVEIYTTIQFFYKLENTFTNLIPREEYVSYYYIKKYNGTYDERIKFGTRYLAGEVKGPDLKRGIIIALKNQYGKYSSSFVTENSSSNPVIVAENDITIPPNIYDRYIVGMEFLPFYKIKSNVQNNAILPESTKPINETYTDWFAKTYEIDPDRKFYKINPQLETTEITQTESQNPVLPVPGTPLWESIWEWLNSQKIQTDVDPVKPIQPEQPTVPDVDVPNIPETAPQPQPVPEVIPEPNPPSPNPPLPICPPTPALILPNSLVSTKMFSIYSLTLNQLNQLGAYLWDESILEQIKKMFFSPLDGVISLARVFAIPESTENATIHLGYLNTGVSALKVKSQFVTVECGTIDTAEFFKNAMDYTPYVSMHIYLPFIGITELDCTDFIAGKITVRYTIDLLTGTCIADIWGTRSPDMPTPQRLYTFSGNVAQSIPLTSSDATGLRNGILSLAGIGLSVASGGKLTPVAMATAGLSAVGSLNHEMVHVSHGGGLSANAGILGFKRPYIIISRRQNYTANSYAGIYGYPANSTIYVKNMRGYMRMLDGHLDAPCTFDEQNEIIELMKNGIICPL